MSTVTLSKIAKGAAMAMNEDIEKVLDRYMYIAKNGLNKITRETLRYKKRRAIVSVDPYTRTAKIPIDCKSVTFVGIINSCGQKIPLRMKTDIVPMSVVEDLREDYVCHKCGTVGHCSDLLITEKKDAVTINGSEYERTVITKIMPNGEYVESAKTPTLNKDGRVVYSEFKRVVGKFELEGCGCISETSANVKQLQDCNPVLFNCYYAKCAESSIDYGGVQVFEEEGFIQLDKLLDITSIYLEYTSGLYQINGEFVVPEEAYDVLVFYIIAFVCESKTNMSAYEKERKWNLYHTERRALRKVKWRVKWSLIEQLVHGLPNFGIGNTTAFISQ